MQNLVAIAFCCLASSGFNNPALADMQAARDAFQLGQFDKSVTELMPVANSGNAEAEFLLGSIYSLGLGRPVDEIRGFDFFYRSASKGHPAAQLRLSAAYSSGAGLAAPDPLRAALWAELALIGRAEGAREQAETLRQSLNAADQKSLDLMLQDYRSYLFPFQQQ